MRIIHYIAGALLLLPQTVSAHEDTASLEEVVVTGRRDHLPERSIHCVIAKDHAGRLRWH
jgi:hypothetical protein